MPDNKPGKTDLVKVLGVYANAFRVVSDESVEDGQCLLDFLVYSQTEDLAQVVGRVRVNKGLLPKIRDEITEVL